MKLVTKVRWQRGISYFVLFSLIVSVIYIIAVMAKAPSQPIPNQPYRRTKSEYVLMLLQCSLGLFAMALPPLLKRRARLEIPSNMMIFYALFLYCAIYLGEVRSFYYHVPHWDTVLHTFSGAMLGALGFSFINFLNNTDRVPVNLSPLFVVTFAFCFAVTLGVFWEIYEFLADAVLRTNMQKYALENGILLTGRAALGDTMKDLIVDTLGALTMSVIGYISLRYQKGWVENLLLHLPRSGQDA
ncbi:hypothetical protein [Marasmitruncus massiliensis]|uniref:hypothetical protein n=1 Tax=Marasmitruncus massiliensis TaxID=1944642 RepID=UPI0015E08076|nr:hypothetical protein [Marasmitruncus massiliensis]